MKDIETLDTTIDEWREALREAEEVSDVKGKTASELAKEFNCSVSTMRLKLNNMVQVGQCKRSLGRRLSSDGRSVPVNVYQLIPKKEEK